MKFDTIWRYVFLEVISPTLLGLCVYVLVFVMNALFELAELAIKKDLSARSVVTILFYYLPRVLEMTIPMAILLGVLVGIGRLSTDSEVVALRASGVSYWKILYPVLTLGIVGWVVSSVLILGVEPGANYKRRQVYNRLMYSADMRREIKPRVFFEDVPGMLLYADEVHQGGDFLEKVFIYQSEEGGKELVTVARRAQIEYDRHSGVAEFYLESGVTHSTTPNEPESYQLSRFEKQMIVKEPDESFKLRSSLLNRPLPKNYHEQTLADLGHSIIRAGAIEHADTRNRVVGNILAIMHERFALPVACLVFAILGVPLGIMNRRGGKASGFSLSIGISIVYWILYIAGQNLVSEGRLSPYLGLWVGNASLGVLGIILLILRERSEGLQLSLLVPARLQKTLTALRRRRDREMESRHDEIGATVQQPGARRARKSTRLSRGGHERIRAGRSGQSGPEDARTPLRAVVSGERQEGLESTSPVGIDEMVEEEDASSRWLSRRTLLVLGGGSAALGLLVSASHIPSLPFLLVGLILLALFLVFRTTVDRYILARFGAIFVGSAATLYTLFGVYELVSLLDDLVEHNLPFFMAFTYLKYRSPWIVTQVLPISCLVATFLTIGIMSRFNEVIALKASGTSIYRIAAPVVVVTVAISAIAYMNQDYLEPYANQRAAQLKDQIRGRSPRSYEPGERRWVFGASGRLFNFRNYVPSPVPVLTTPGSGEFQGFSAYHLDPESFDIDERIYARSATFVDGRWVLKDGWIRAFPGGQESFETFAEKSFDFPEGPSYFVKEWKTPAQMNFTELQRFVTDLKRRGYDVQELTVDLYDKTALPIVSLTMVILGIPFCFKMGKRGSLYGIGIAVCLVAVFLIVFSTTNALGGIGLMPPFLAAWAPNVLFAGSGVYLLLRTGT
ncbi:MAG TPA: LptF/LptG family permease [Candidatus Dormibacteraeota bacterium]|nr:LptF/LptG family permease [Candidatus Dormibacteraeota bacterium]